MQLAGHLKGRALQEYNLLRPEEKESFESAVEALRSRLEPGSKAVAAQDFRHATQRHRVCFRFYQATGTYLPHCVRP